MKGLRPFNLPFNKMPYVLKLLPALNGSGQGNIIGLFQFGAKG